MVLFESPNHHLDFLKICIFHLQDDLFLRRINETLPWSYSVCVKPQQFVWALVNQRSSPRQNFHCKTHTFCSHALKKYYKRNVRQILLTERKTNTTNKTGQIESRRSRGQNGVEWRRHKSNGGCYQSLEESSNPRYETECSILTSPNTSDLKVMILVWNCESGWNYEGVMTRLPFRALYKLEFICLLYLKDFGHFINTGQCRPLPVPFLFCTSEKNSFLWICESVNFSLSVNNCLWISQSSWLD